MENPETRADRERLVSSLGIPMEAETSREFVENGGEISAAGLAALVDGDVAERTWLDWNPGQRERLAIPGFRAALETMLSAGVGVGYSIDRFRPASTSLPDPDPEGDRWVEAFERTVAARNSLDLCVYVRPEIRETLLDTNAAADKDAERWDSMLSLMADGLFYELGIVVPRVELLVDESLAPTEIRIDVNDAHLPRRFLIPSDRVLVNDTVDRLTLLNVRGEEAVNPANLSECATVSSADAKICEQAGLTTWNQADYAVLSISATVRQMAGAFVSTHLVHFFCDRLSQAFPTVVEEMKKTMSQAAIAQVLRALVDEEISIRNLVRVFQVLTLPQASIPADLSRQIVFSPSVLQRSQLVHDPDAQMSFLERRLFCVRSSMARYISHKFTRGGNTLVVYLLDPGMEARLAHPRPLSSRDRAVLVRAVRDEVGNLPATAQHPVILTTAAIRRRLRREIAPAFPRLAVLSYPELSPDMNIQPLARIQAPELGDLFARLGLHDGDGSSPVALSLASDDPLVTSLLAAKARVVAATQLRRASREHAIPLMGECLDAILGEVAGESTAAQLANVLPGRADVRVQWDRVVELILSIGRAACGVIERPTAEGPEERRRFYADVARVRAATHRLARAVAEAGVGDHRRADSR
jgi:hypothetical protein